MFETILEILFNSHFISPYLPSLLHEQQFFLFFFVYAEHHIKINENIIIELDFCSSDRWFNTLRTPVFFLIIVLSLNGFTNFDAFVSFFLFSFDTFYFFFVGFHDMRELLAINNDFWIIEFLYLSREWDLEGLLFDTKSYNRKEF